MAYYISCMLTVPRNALLVLLWADGIWHPNLLRALLLGQGLGSTQAPNEPTYKYLHRTGCTSGHESK